MAHFMICPLDLNIKQQHIYTLLYKKSTFKDNYKVSYTTEQLYVDSDSSLDLTERMIRTILKQLSDKNYIIEIEKGRKGYPTVYSINVNYVSNSGHQCVTNVSPMCNQSVTNDEPISTNIDYGGNESVTNVSPMCNQSVNPIIKDKEKRIKEGNIYIADIIDYLNLKAGKSFKNNSAKAVSCLNARWNEGFKDIEEYKRVIDRKCESWIEDVKMVEYLRPETLFGTKFEGYLNEQPIQLKSNKTPEEVMIEYMKGLNG